MDAWLLHAEAASAAYAVDRYASYVPETGWASILAVLELPDASAHLWALANALQVLISQYGDAFIDRIEAEARVSSAFKACLALIHPSPSFPLPRSLWDRLSAAAGTPLGPMKPHMAALYADLPGLDEAVSTDPSPMDPAESIAVSPPDLRGQAERWVQYYQSMWAGTEISRLVRDEPEAAWPLLLALAERGDDPALATLGAGDIEDLLRWHGPAFIDRIEATAGASARFRFALSHAWRAGTSEEQWHRVRQACGDEPERG